MRLLYSSITCLIMCLTFSVSAQDTGQTNLQAHKNGVLIVRIATNQKKVDYFDKVLNEPDLNEKTKARFQKLKADAVELRNINLTNIIAGFENNYYFSEYRFIYDTDIKQIGQGKTKGVFINAETYELDPSISLPKGKPIFYLRAGDYKYGPHPYFITGIITNQDFIDVPGRAFKSKVKFKERFGTFAKKEKEVLPTRAVETSKNLNHRLWFYYQKENPE